jgi:hypothetical protein
LAHGVDDGDEASLNPADREEAFFRSLAAGWDDDVPLLEKLLCIPEIQTMLPDIHQSLVSVPFEPHR